MLDRAAPQKGRYADRPHKSWLNNYIQEQRKLSKTWIKSKKIMKKNITGELTLLKEISATGC